MGGAVAVLLLYVVFRSRDYCRSPLDLLAGITVGFAVLGTWYVTGGPLGRAWIEDAAFMDFPPTGVGVQSYTFVNPTGELLSYVVAPGAVNGITFGVATLIGIGVGAAAYAVVTRNFRIEWFVSVRDFVRHLVGGALMGTGGVLAMGCTIGQAVSGFSTLAVGSMLAFFSIVLGSALTMKVEYYKLVYEGEASLVDALLSALVDLRLLPRRLRRLQSV